MKSFSEHDTSMGRISPKAPDFNTETWNNCYGNSLFIDKMAVYMRSLLCFGDGSVEY